MKPIIAVLVVVIFVFGSVSCEKDEYNGCFYFNSFEKDSDTIGWKGGQFSFYDEAPEDGGKKSLYVSGGCMAPHAEYRFGPFKSDKTFTISFWAKAIENQGAVDLHSSADNTGNMISVNDTIWQFYAPKLAVEVLEGDMLILDVFAGGIMSASMLVDMIKIEEL